jgi:hypothetical protein
LESELERLPAETVPKVPKLPSILTRSLTDPEFEPRTAETAPVENFLDTDETCSAHQPLSPQLQGDSDIDPFDTSFAVDLQQPGPAELKLLEAELIGK